MGDPIDREYVDAHVADAKAAGEEADFNWELVLDVSIYETGWGKDSTILNAGAENNFFGIKAGIVKSHRATGEALVPTTEFDENGVRYETVDKFYKYASYKAAALDFIDWVTGVSGLTQYEDIERHDFDVIAKSLETIGYSTEKPDEDDPEGLHSGYAWHLRDIRDRLHDQAPDLFGGVQNGSDSNDSASDAELDALQDVSDAMDRHPEIFSKKNAKHRYLWWAVQKKKHGRKKAISTEGKVMPYSKKRADEFFYTFMRSNEGYDQGQRFSFDPDRDGKNIIPNREGDCSAVNASAAKAGGANVDMSDPISTANLAERFKDAGAEIIAFESLDQMEDGDYIIGAGHTCYQLDGKFFSMESDENGEASGGEAGNQTGKEWVLRNPYVRSRGWQVIARFHDSGEDISAPSDSLMRLGSGGDNVLAWTSWLRAMFSYARNVTPGRYFGNDTAQATIEFQRRAGLTPDGIVGKNTLAKARELGYKG